MYIAYIMYSSWLCGYARCAETTVCLADAPSPPRVQELIVLDGPIHVHIHTGEPETASAIAPGPLFTRQMIYT